MSDMMMPPGDPGGMPPEDPMAQNKFMNRDRPEPPDQVRKLVKRWCDRVRRAKTHWKTQFSRMRENMAFVDGEQWPDTPRNGERDDRYVANVCIRHVQQRTAELYPNNPTMKATKRAKMIATTWDGSGQSLMQAQQASMLAAQYMLPPDPQSAAIMQDAALVQQWDQLLERIGKTLELLYDYNVDEQTHSFKSGMKMTVRRAIITSVGYVKLGFQRAMRMRPEIEARIADMSERLAHIERLAGDLADGEIQENSADVEALRISIESLMTEGQIVVREGLTFDYPDSTSVIPDPKCRTLRGFLGADWVAQEYLLSVDEIEEIYMVDVGTGYTVYDENGHCTDTTAEFSNDHYRAGGGDEGDQYKTNRACVWEIYHRKDGTVYVVCDGFPDWLQKPSPPDSVTQRFWPWYAFVLNEGYSEKKLFPQSDIDLIRDMQLELNRARQGLREHRRANRPKTAVAAGVLEEPDKDKLRTHPANALLELNALAPGQKIDDVLQVVKMPPIDPAIYDTAPVWEDVLRVLGSDQADMGSSTSGATATEVSVAEFSQNTDATSIIDDMNDMLTELARGASEILVLNVSPQIVQQVVGPGAVWPELDKQSVAENVWLEVDVGANGPPNVQQDVQHLVQLVPLLQRVPGISPEWLARQLIRRMGDDIDISEAFAEGAPSIEAMNQIASHPPAPPGASGGPGDDEDSEGGGTGRGPPRPPGPANDPNAQGAAGPANAPAANPPGSIGPRPPPLQVFGRNGNAPGTGGGMPRAAGARPGFPTP